MGQRLVITGVYNDKRIFNVYYHWSAYTNDAVVATKTLISDKIKNFLEERKEIGYTNIELYNIVVQACKESGSIVSASFDERKRLGISTSLKTLLLKNNVNIDFLNGNDYDLQNDFETIVKLVSESGNIEAKKVFESDFPDRNSGLVSISEESMDNSQSWSEGDVRIYYDDMTIDFEVCYIIPLDESRSYDREDAIENEDYITDNLLFNLNNRMTVDDFYNFEKICDKKYIFTDTSLKTKYIYIPQ